MSRKPRPVPTAEELRELKELWRKVLPRIEEELGRAAARSPAEAAGSRGAQDWTGKRPQ
ncbi:MAG: hypothetical protein IOC82_06780 [Aestuariivirga sp.]|uniref:hypothetical protein n=1 Tax=Aestuariivirga sp. TaxID=2650926 RepID=UPI0025C2AEA2|nr:hypothetical protein [Aestuariivirga sp.]MCA3560719.1 hypothetical protein [Aestuariivirga sp.]